MTKIEVVLQMSFFVLHMVSSKCLMFEYIIVSYTNSSESQVILKDVLYRTYIT